VDPVTGESRFTNEPDANDEAPVNQESKEKDPSKAYCVDCDKAIEGRMIVVSDNFTYHADCFCCSQCNRQFEMNALKYTLVGDSYWCFRCISVKDQEGMYLCLFFLHLSFLFEMRRPPSHYFYLHGRSTRTLTASFHFPCHNKLTPAFLLL